MVKEEKRYAQQRTFLEAAGVVGTKIEGEIVAVPYHDLPVMPHAGLQLFRNEFYEITLAQGLETMTFAVDGHQYAPDQSPFICFIAASQLQSYTFHQAPRAPYGFNLYCSKNALKNIEQQMGPIPFFHRENQSFYPLTEEQFTALVHWAECLYEAQNESHHHVKALLTSFLTVLLIRAKDTLPLKRNELFSRPESVVEQFLTQVSSNRQHQSVQFYADRLALTAKQLNTLLRKVVNKTASQVIQEATINRAKGLLLQSDKNISEVAYELGFNELSNFSRLFKRSTGHSPRHFQSRGPN